MRAILDTAVMVAAIRSDAGASRRLLVAGLERRLTLLLKAAEGFGVEVLVPGEALRRLEAET